MKTSIKYGFLISLIISFFLKDCLAQNISGIINNYTNVTSISGNILTVGSTNGFTVGDKVLIIQMKGVSIDNSNTASFGQITSYNEAGNYEYSHIQSINGNQITLTEYLCNNYSISGAVQLIKVPVYVNAIINNTLTCQPWNGTTGGVLAFEVTGNLEFNANVDVSGTGFRGGNFFTGFFNCNTNVYAGLNHGKKGEGIANFPPGLDAGRAPLANGGGGSLNGNCGAGGGGNYGSGGRGGDVYSGCGINTIWGDGGYPLLVNNPNKIFMGGGGGGGYRDNGQVSTNGANGGGLVMITANSINGNNFSILAKGNDVTTVTNDEGAGGGGAGGAVYIWCQNYTSNLTINVSGGNGGSINNTIFTNNAHGPGGGGGGGYIWLSTPNLPVNVNAVVNGGNAGLILHNGPFQNTTYGATNGNNGGVLFNLPPITPSLPIPNLGNDTSICQGVNLILDAGPNYPTYLWNDGSTNQSLSVNSTGYYWVEVPIGCTTYRDSIFVTVNPSPIITLDHNISVCVDDTLFLVASGGINYIWSGPNGFSSNDQNPQILNASSNIAGYYTVFVTDINGCSNYDSTLVVVNNLPTAIANNDGPVCEGLNISLSATGGADYLWIGPNGFNSISQYPTITNVNSNNNGIYTVTVTDANGCTSTATTTITVYAIPTASFSAVNLSGCSQVCTEFTDQSSVIGTTISSWDWSSNGVTFSNQQNPTQCFTNPGLYDIGLTVTSELGCSASINMNDFIQVFDNPVADFIITPDYIQSNTVVQFTDASIGDIQSWSWNFGDGGVSSVQNPQYIYTDSGTFCITLRVTATGGCTEQDVECLHVNSDIFIYIPNSFTPNEDKINDWFRVEGKGIAEVIIEIFDRWGKSIFSTNSLEGWPGTIGNENTYAKQDVYVYKVKVIDMLDKEHDFYGHVNLIR